MAKTDAKTPDMMMIDVKKMNPAPYNPRVDLKKDSAEYQHIKNSIESFGYLDPIVWNKRTGNIVSGHQRYKIMVDDGYTELLVRVVDFDEEKEKACNLAMNKAVGLWDVDKMNALLAEMTQTEWDMTQYGFDKLEEELNKEETDISDTYKEHFQVIIDCSDEGMMEQVYQQLTDEGYICRVSTL